MTSPDNSGLKLAATLILAATFKNLLEGAYMLPGWEGLNLIRDDLEALCERLMPLAEAHALQHATDSAPLN